MSGGQGPLPSARAEGSGTVDADPQAQTDTGLDPGRVYPTDWGLNSGARAALTRSVAGSHGVHEVNGSAPARVVDSRLRRARARSPSRLKTCQIRSPRRNSPLSPSCPTRTPAASGTSPLTQGMWAALQAASRGRAGRRERVKPRTSSTSHRHPATSGTGADRRGARRGGRPDRRAFRRDGAVEVSMAVAKALLPGEPTWNRNGACWHRERQEPAGKFKPSGCWRDWRMLKVSAVTRFGSSRKSQRPCCPGRPCLSPRCPAGDVLITRANTPLRGRSRRSSPRGCPKRPLHR